MLMNLVQFLFIFLLALFCTIAHSLFLYRGNDMLYIYCMMSSFGGSLSLPPSLRSARILFTNFLSPSIMFSFVEM